MIISLLSKAKNFFFIIDQYIIPFNPVSFMKLLWDILIMIDFLLMFFLIPIKTALAEDWNVFLV